MTEVSAWTGVIVDGKLVIPLSAEERAFLEADKVRPHAATVELHKALHSLRQVGQPIPATRLSKARPSTRL